MSERDRFQRDHEQRYAEYDLGARIQDWSVRLVAVESHQRNIAQDFVHVQQEFRATQDRVNAFEEPLQSLQTRIAELSTAYNDLATGITNVHAKRDAGTRDLERRFKTNDSLLVE